MFHAPFRSRVMRLRDVAPTGVLAIGLAACSGTDGAPAPADAAPTKAVSSSASIKEVSHEAIDRTRPTSVQTTPEARCSVHPDGAKGDASRTEFLVADEEGVVRFFPPPRSWGSRLSLDCTSSSHSAETHVVDLDDESTFFRESALLETPRVIGSRPALSGDLASIPQERLMAAGYPRRPDPNIAPKDYEAWARRVSKPMDIVWAKGVAAIGHAGTPFEGRFNETANPNNWSGLIMDAQGFNLFNGGANTFGFTEYLYYASGMYVPGNTCSGPCSALVWGGLGGYASGALVQSGVQAIGGSSMYLFYEYFQNGIGNNPWVGPIIEVMPPNAIRTNYGDEIVTFAFSGDANANMDTNGEYAYYTFDNFTSGQATGRFKIAANTSGTNTWPLNAQTFESVVEKPNGLQFTSYGSTLMDTVAYDSSFNLHTDSTDPYILASLYDPNGFVISEAGFSSAASFPPPGGPFLPDTSVQPWVTFYYH